MRRKLTLFRSTSQKMTECRFSKGEKVSQEGESREPSSNRSLEWRKERQRKKTAPRLGGRKFGGEGIKGYGKGRQRPGVEKKRCEKAVARSNRYSLACHRASGLEKAGKSSGKCNTPCCWRKGVKKKGVKKGGERKSRGTHY